MAILKTDNKEVEVPDGSSTMNAAEELGVSFGCRQGVCGTCKTEVVDGNYRSMCQCKIKSGTVKIRL